jgi:hypothetical protein
MADAILRGDRAALAKSAFWSWPPVDLRQPPSPGRLIAN